MNVNQDLTQIIFKTRQFIWYNPAVQDVITTTILTQNENGPCALIALLNCMILQRLCDKCEENNRVYSDEVSLEIDKLIRLLNRNNKITLSLLTQILATILLLCTNTSSTNSEISGVSSILDLLPKLYYGLNINPNFITGTISTGAPIMQFDSENILNIMRQNIPENVKTSQNNIQKTSDELGFSSIVDRGKLSPEYLLFKTLKVPVYHGWVLPDESNIQTRLLSRLKDFDSCQNFVIYAEELLSNNEDNCNANLTDENKNLLKLSSEIVYSWLNESSIQFTEQGLKSLWSNNIGKTKFAVFFRNDHFSTIYSHENKTFVLVTDEGFSNLNIFWQELNSSSGDEKFYDPFFIEVTKDSIAKFQNPVNGNISTEKSDFSLARQLQREEMRAAEKLKKEKKKKKKFLLL